MLITISSQSAICGLIILGAVLGLLCLIRKRIDISGLLPFMGIVSVLGAQAVYTIYVDKILGAITFALAIVTIVLKCCPKKMKAFLVFAVLFVIAIALEALEVAGYPLVF